jgi:hypothetical protein
MAAVSFFEVTGQFGDLPDEYVIILSDGDVGYLFLDCSVM